MTMESGYSLTLHVSILYLDQKPKFVFLVNGGMYLPQVLKFSQILWIFSNYYKTLK
jgi:hypothetical protein